MLFISKYPPINKKKLIYQFMKTISDPYIKNYKQKKEKQ